MNRTICACMNRVILHAFKYVCMNRTICACIQVCMHESNYECMHRPISSYIRVYMHELILLFLREPAGRNQVQFPKRCFLEFGDPYDDYSA
jgi:hypothetical protein